MNLFFVAAALVLVQQCAAAGRSVTVPFTEITTHAENGKLNELIEEMVKSHSILVFSSARCDTCHKATEILEKNGLSYDFYDYDTQPGSIYIVDEVKKENNAETLPLIYICKQFIGSYTELEQLDKSGALKSKASC